MNLYKLLHLKGRNIIYRNKITIEDDTLQICRVTRSYWDYGNKKALWSEVFFKYMSIIISFFRSTVDFSFTLTLAGFHRKILDLFKIYRW